MSTFTIHPYSLRTRSGKTEANTARAATSTADQDMKDQNSPRPVARRLSSDVVSSQKTLHAYRGGQESVADPSDKGNSPSGDLDATKRSGDQGDPTPDQDLSRWIKDHLNKVRRSHTGLSSLTFSRTTLLGRPIG